MQLTADQIADLIVTTLADLGRGRWTDLTSDLTEYEVLPRMLKRGKVKFAGGDGIQRNVMLNDSGAAKHVGLYNVDDLNVGDTMGTLDVPWRHTTTNYAFDVREKAMNAGANQIVDLIKTRRADAFISLAKLLEDTFWSKPDSSADKVTPFGLLYWIVKSATEGFNGGNPAGFADGAGNLDSTTYERWRNWTAQYANVTKDDLIRKMRKAHRRTNFKSPVDIPDYRERAGQRWRIYVNEETIAAMEDLGEAQNENLGRDLASMDGSITFRKNPIIYVPKLDEDSTNPVYMVDWSVFFIYFLRGHYIKESKPMPAPTQHNVVNVHVDMSHNTLCVDRRRLAVLSK